VLLEEIAAGSWDGVAFIVSLEEQGIASIQKEINRTRQYWKLPALG
jgi:hypothetical protein